METIPTAQAPPWPPRRIFTNLGFALFLFWVFLGSSLWIYRRSVPLPVRFIGLPVILTTWPAYQASLVLTGHSLGANLPPQPTPLGLAALAAWCLVLWSPLLSLRLRKIPLTPALVTQAAMILLVLWTFEKFGNG